MRAVIILLIILVFASSALAESALSSTFAIF